MKKEILPSSELPVFRNGIILHVKLYVCGGGVGGVRWESKEGKERRGEGRKLEGNIDDDSKDWEKVKVTGD